jgi:hypothetical protein
MCTLNKRWADSSRTGLEAPRLQAFIGVYRDGGGLSWKTGFCVINSETGLCIIDSSNMLVRRVLALVSQTESKTLEKRKENEQKLSQKKKYYVFGQE